MARQKRDDTAIIEARKVDVENQHRIILVRIKYPASAFELVDILAKQKAFPDLLTHVKHSIRQGICGYIEDGQAFLKKAIELNSEQREVTTKDKTSTKNSY